MGKQWKRWETLCLGAPKSLQMLTAAMKLKTLAPWKKSYGQSRHHIKKQRHYFANKGPSSQSYGLSSGHVWMWELDYKENWMPKNWCFWTVVLEKTLESPLDCKEIQPVNSKGNQPWIVIGRTNAEAESSILCPPDVENWLIGKDPDAGTDWRQEKKQMAEDEMVGWHHWLDGQWVLASSRSWWWTGHPGMLQSMGLQRVGHDWVTEQNLTELTLMSTFQRVALRSWRKTCWGSKMGDGGEIERRFTFLRGREGIYMFSKINALRKGGPGLGSGRQWWQGLVI